MPPAIKLNLKSTIVKCVLHRKVKRLLAHVPPDDLIGLNSICLSYNSFNSNNKNLTGEYILDTKNRSSKIYVYVNTLYYQKLYLAFIPFVGTFFLANTLYHEIGHHQHTFHMHNVKKKDWEGFANSYKLYLLRKRYRFLLFAKKPLRKLIRLISGY